MTASTSPRRAPAEQRGLVQRIRHFRDPHGLAERVWVLEADMLETRQLNTRIAELTDLVGQLLVELAQMDPERAAEIIERYQADLGS